MRSPRETDLVRAVLDYLTHVRRIPAWRINTGAARFGRRLVRFGTPGMADIIAVLPGGRFGAFEIKMPGKAPTPLQEAFLDLVRAGGGVAGVVRSIDELEALLGEQQP